MEHIEMKIKLGSIKGLIKKRKLEKDHPYLRFSVLFDRGYNHAAGEIANKEIEVNVCQSCQGDGDKSIHSGKGDCSECHGSGVVVAVGK